MGKKVLHLSLKQIAVIILPLIVVSASMMLTFRTITSNIIKEDIVERTTLMNEKVKMESWKLFQPGAIALNTLSSIAGFGLDQGDMDELITGTSELYPQYAAFFFATVTPVTSPEGYIVMSDGWKPTHGWTQTEAEWYKAALQAQGKTITTDPYFATRLGGKPCITFATAVYDAENPNAIIGVIGCDILLDHLVDIVSSIHFSTNARLYVVDEQGTYLTHPDAEAVMRRNYFNDTALDPKQYTAASYLDGSKKTFIQGGTFFAVSPVGENKQWFAVIEAPLTDFTEDFQSSMVVIILVVGGLIVLYSAVALVVMNSVRGKEERISEQLFAETQNLVVAAKENAATSQDQSAAVKEIVATMEDNNALSESISVKIKDVSSVASKTSGDVSDGVGFLEQNVRQLHEIADANQKTIDGMKVLGEKIENIWDIVTLINSVADQAKIIAFNAELEAASAGEAGKNFHIVATEIRRLADNIIEGTKEIKERINEIQESSDSLMLASESGTEKINAGYQNAKNLEQRFESIKNASEVTAGSAGDITTIIQQQAAASEQILITLKQIAAGVENFTTATDNISAASQNLRTIAEELNEPHKPQANG